MSGSPAFKPRGGAKAAICALAGLLRASARLLCTTAALLLASCSDGGLDFGAWTPAGDEPGRILLNCAVRGQLALDVVVQGRGTVERSDAARTLDGRSCHDVGASVELLAVADEGWMFAGFTGDADSLAPDLAIRLEEDSRVTATFERIRESDLPQMLAPFPAAVSAVVLQGPFGPYTHGDEYAWDFRMPVGTSVLAARSGVVVDLREDQPSHDPDDPVAEGPANFVMLDHGDGLLTRYVHLDEMGVLAEIGDSVVLGQVIALSGNSGLSFEPHLHFETRRADGSPYATGLAESPRPDGVAEEGDMLRSRNRTIAPASLRKRAACGKFTGEWAGCKRPATSRTAGTNLP
ncbi:MAG: M23 family metallopeptidase [Phycisphaerales bacterium]|nr:M23 family metallopeptidase [Phycisphaerales bacterium]